LQHTRNFRERIELQIEARQPLAQRRIGQLQGVHCEAERVARDPPEVGVLPLKGPQPGVLKLLLAPERVEALELIAEHLPTTGCCRCIIEQCSVRVKTQARMPSMR
jgi:hypothetical protein